MTSCPDDNELARLVDGALAAEDRARVEAHLDTCASCAELLQALARDGTIGHGADEPPTLAPPRAAAATRRAGPGRPARYRPLRELARGGMGRVVEAFDEELGRVVALKQTLDDHPVAQLRLEREVALTARLEHPAIVPVYDVGEHDGSVFYVMRKVGGTTLEQLVRAAPALDQRLLFVPHVLAAADALAHAHARGVIHRDLKPTNILVGELGETVVIDWGLAKRLDVPDDGGEPDAATTTADRVRDEALRTAAGSVGGTPGFMAPEQAHAHPTDARADVFALGACLHYVLAARLPFAGRTSDELLAHTRAGERLPIDVDGVPPDLVTIVDKAMAHEPARRYPDASGFSDDLRRFLNGQLVAAHHYSPLARAGRWVRRHRGLVAALAAGLAVASIVGVVAVRRVIAEQARTAAADQRAVERADELVLARAAAAPDPTHAVAALGELRPDSPRWATLDALGLQLQLRGIVSGYPGHARFVFAHFAPDPADRRVVTVGDGTVRLHDLAAHTSRVVARGPRWTQAYWWGPELLVTHRADAGAELFAGTAPPLAIPWLAATDSLASDGRTLVRLTRDGRVDVVEHSLATAGAALARATPRALDVRGAKRIELVAGRWIAASGDGSTRLFRRAAAGGWELATEVPYGMRFVTANAAGTRLATLVADRVDIVELDTTTFAELRHLTSINAAIDLAYHGDRLHAATADGIVALDEAGATRLTEATSFAHVDALGPGLAVLTGPHEVTLAQRDLTRVLRAPIPVDGIIADPLGRSLLAWGAGRVVAWDLAHVLPRLHRLEAAGTPFFVADDAIVVVSESSGGPRSIDRFALAPSGPLVARTQRFGSLPPFVQATAIGHGQLLAYAMTLELGPPRVLGWPARADLRAAVALDADQLLVGTATGTVERVTRAGTTERLGELPAAIEAVAASPAGWLAALDGTGTLWRRAPSGEVSRTQLVGSITSDVAIDDHGVVYVGLSRQLVRWDGLPPRAITTLGTAADTTPVGPVETRSNLAILEVHVVADGRVLTHSRNSMLALHDPATGTHRVLARPAIPAHTGNYDVSADGALLVAHVSREQLVAIDLRTLEQWPISDRLGGPLGLAPDGRRLAVASDRDLLVFDLARPPVSPAWIRATTNARAPRGLSDDLDFVTD